VPQKEDLSTLYYQIAWNALDPAEAIHPFDADDIAEGEELLKPLAKIIADGVKELVAVADKARTMVKDYDATGKDAMTIRREVIAKVYGDEAVADMTSDAEITAAFKVAQSTAKADPVLDAMGKTEKKEKPGDAWAGKFKAKKEDK